MIIVLCFFTCLPLSLQFLVCMCLVTQSCPTFFEPVDYNPPGSSVHGMPQARILEWVAISFSRLFVTQGSNPHLLGLLHWQADYLPLRHCSPRISFPASDLKKYCLPFFSECLRGVSNSTQKLSSSSSIEI